MVEMVKPAVLIFDVGKTNKKIMLFDEKYNLLYEESAILEETSDEDGFSCENVDTLSNWVRQKYEEVAVNKAYELRAVNFSAYGASFVNMGKDLTPVTPLYNYLKPYPEHLKKQFYDTHGGENLIARQTASPVLGHLNSGMLLYRLKYEKPELFSQIRHSLHLPQYLSFLLTGGLFSDITSIGCHTQLWDYNTNAYHQWVRKEAIDILFAPILSASKTVSIKGTKIVFGIGLHDSSSALIPYLASFNKPFILLSTGTWCISLNPFNHSPLSDDELQRDCLSYMTFEGKPIKASRLFAGFEHEQQIKRIAAHFSQPPDYYKSVMFDASEQKKMHKIKTTRQMSESTSNFLLQQSGFGERELNNFESYEQAYHQLMNDIIIQQIESLKLVFYNSSVDQIFVDGGFALNNVYMNMLACSLPNIKISAAVIGHASALGAALAIHKSWNNKQVPENLLSLKYYPTKIARSY
jgi:L-fuculokinase